LFVQFTVVQQFTKTRLTPSTAREIFRSATREGRAAIVGQILDDSLIEFRLGNLPAHDFCEVEVSCAFVANSPGPNELFFKSRWTPARKQAARTASLQI
jgi:hypothetical protein